MLLLESILLEVDYGHVYDLTENGFLCGKFSQLNSSILLPPPIP